MTKPKRDKSKSSSTSTKQKSPEEIAKEHQRYAEAGRKCYKHASKDLYKAILAVLPDLKDDDGNYDQPAVELSYTACKIFDALGAKSRRFSFSLHHMYTVANPAIVDKTNPAYSPIYDRYACGLPQDVSGELDALEEDGAKLVPHRDKIVGDRRYAIAGIAIFGTAWDCNGYPIKLDASGAPFRDGWYGSICDRIDALQAASLAKNRRNRPFQAFLVAHTRDDRSVLRDAEVALKPRHLQGAISLADPTTTYHFMESMGVNFEDYVEAFRFIADAKTDKKRDRIKSFMATLQGLLKNFIIPDHWDSTLQYLVHQSAGAIKEDKPPYKVAEVRSWLPDDPGKTYADIAGVYDNELPASDLNSDIIKNLHNAYNISHHVADLVGHKADDCPFTYKMLRNFRSLMTHARGKNSPSSKSLELIPQAIMCLIRKGNIAVGDWPTLLHAAFDEADADALMGDEKFNKRMSYLINAEIKATIADESYDRNLQTTIITASVGGIGKSYLAKLLAAYFDHGRKPYSAATVDKKKTPDLWQQYDNELSAILDELGPGTISLQTWKDTFDQHKLPPLPSRNTNRTPVFVHHAFITDVFPGGVAEYVRKVLRYSEGVTEWGYLEQVKNRRTDKVEWRLKQNSEDAAKHYLSQLSQILRRLPVWIEMSPTSDSKATNIKISILAYKASGRAMTHYDFCHTANSCFRINTVLTDKTPKADAKRIGKKVADEIAALQAQADAVFDKDITAWLPDTDNFIADNCRLGVRDLDGHLSLVDLDSAPDLAGYASDVNNEADDIFG